MTASSHTAEQEASECVRAGSRWWQPAGGRRYLSRDKQYSGKHTAL